MKKLKKTVILSCLLCSLYFFTLLAFTWGYELPWIYPSLRYRSAIELTLQNQEKVSVKVNFRIRRNTKLVRRIDVSSFKICAYKHKELAAKNLPWGWEKSISDIKNVLTWDVTGLRPCKYTFLIYFNEISGTKEKDIEKYGEITANLLPNGDFELSSSEPTCPVLAWRKQCKNKGEVITDFKTYFSGSCSLMFIPGNNGTSRVRCSFIPVHKGTVYKFEAYAKTESKIDTPGKGSWSVYFDTIGYNQNKKYITGKGRKVLGSKLMKHDWKKYEMYFLPEEEVKYIQLRLGAACFSGTTWIDKVTFLPISIPELKTSEQKR